MAFFPVWVVVRVFPSLETVLLVVVTAFPAFLATASMVFASTRFNAMVKNNELLEWAEVFGNFYGTPRAPVEQALAAGHDVLFDIDWQGTQQLREQIRGDMASIFVLPPSTDELERRLRARALDDERVIKARMAKAGDELSHWPEYDYVIINDDIEKAFAQVRAILGVERLRRERQPWISAFVRKLLGEL